MTTTAVSILLSAILSATGPSSFPARISMNATSLHDLAVGALAPGGHLHVACADLYDDVKTGTLTASGRGFGSDDAKVIGFFLERNTKYATLECVCRAAGHAG